MSWKKTTLGKTVNLKRGYDLTSDERKNGGTPVVSSSGITGTHDEAMADGPGVVTGRYGSLGSVYYIEEDFWPHNTTLYVEDFKGNHPRFVYYLLKSLDLERYSATTSVPGLNRNDLHRMGVKLPPLSTQRRIANILGALDDKIELNRQMNQTLEAMAQALYRHWFVDFGPFQDEPFQDSELGPIPEGWKVKPISDVVKMKGGSTPRTSVDEYWQGGDITWFTPTDLTSAEQMYLTRSDRQITEEGLNSCSTNYIPPYSLMMTSRATVGVVAFNRTRACTNQGFINIMPQDEVSRFQVYFWIDQMMPEIMARADGSTYPEISQRDFKPLPIIVPPQEDVEDYIRQSQDLFDLIENNILESDTLAETRDYLLPKLISGEIEVSPEPAESTS